jgi:hypothetical protein
VLSTDDVAAVLAAEQELDLTVKLRNIGGRKWSSQGAEPVRLLVRWYDTRSGIRSQYRIEWLQMSVPPRGGALLNITVKAPSRAARYRVNFALMQLPNGQYQPPSATEGASARDIEPIGEASFTVTAQ